MPEYVPQQIGSLKFSIRENLVPKLAKIRLNKKGRVTLVFRDEQRPALKKILDVSLKDYLVARFRDGVRFD